MSIKAVNYFGKDFKSVADLAVYLDIPQKLLAERIRNNCPQDRWGEKPKNNSLTYQNNIYPSVKVLAKHLGISASTLRERIRLGWPEKNGG